ncbi:unnamed protein product [Protopolystoma xenopodis]|uniref:Uncharacterized protein n=1 Tax=Protopolystoma xenopodis TaxID=117903 RepID=A0A3S5APD5_9PLAT|nr:unnamed protein product [Protopolystoma xenopodis]
MLSSASSSTSFQTLSSCRNGLHRFDRLAISPQASLTQALVRLVAMATLAHPPPPVSTASFGRSVDMATVQSGAHCQHRPRQDHPEPQHHQNGAQHSPEASGPHQPHQPHQPQQPSHQPSRVGHSPSRSLHQPQPHASPSPHRHPSTCGQLRPDKDERDRPFHVERAPMAPFGEQHASRRHEGIE